MTCLPLKLERREEELEDDVACLFAGLKPAGALYGFDPDGLTLEVHMLAYQTIVFSRDKSSLLGLWSIFTCVHLV